MAPATIDAGNWLAYGHALLGEHVRSSSLQYPPVVPLATALGVAALGVTRGVAVVGALASIAPGAAVAYVLARARLGWCAVGLGLAVMAAGATGEMTAWGGFPQLAGTALLVILLWHWDRFVCVGRTRDAAASGLLLAGLLATSDFVAPLAVASAGLIWLIHRFPPWGHPAGGPGTRRPALVNLAWLTLPAVLFLPLYAHLGRAVAASYGQRPAAARLALRDIPGRIEYTYRDLTALWRPAVMAALATPLLLVARRAQALWVLTTTLLAVPLAAAALLHEERFFYVLPAAVALAAGLWAREFADQPPRRLVRAVLAVTLAAVVAVQAVTGLRLFVHQRDQYAIVNADVLHAMAWVGTHTPAGSRIAVASVQNAPLGWWVEGYGRRPTLTATPLRWVVYPDERRRAIQANAIFGPGFPDDRALARARRDGANYLLVPLGSPLVNRGRVQRYSSQNQAEVAYANSSAIILRVPSAGPPAP